MLRGAEGCSTLRQLSGSDFGSVDGGFVRIALPLLMGTTVLSACLSDFRPRFRLPSDCEAVLYFEDRDGDGWGAIDGLFQETCEPDPERFLTSRNNFDCDDEDERITGRTATLCPQNLVTGGSAFKQFVAAGKEIAAVLPSDGYAHVSDPDIVPTAAVWPAAASQACGSLGWGGNLLVVSNQTELGAVTSAIDAELGPSGHYAAWIAVVPNESETQWVWEGVASGMPLATIGFCDPGNIPDPADSTNPDRRLALVRRASGAWCIGLPSDANPAAPAERDVVYGVNEAHLVCARTAPRAIDYVVRSAPS
jgi:hypothetical protein